MKKKLIILALLSIVAAFPSQARKAYAQLLGYDKGLFTNKVKVTIDFGQNVSFWKPGDMTIVDENGKDVVFNSMVDAMNFMGQCGWDLVQAFVESEGSNKVYHWILVKEVNSDEEIKAGFNIRADVRKSDMPTYTLTYLKKGKKANQWDVVKTETKKLTPEEITALSDEWKAQTNDNYDYDFQVKKEK